MCHQYGDGEAGARHCAKDEREDAEDGVVGVVGAKDDGEVGEVFASADGAGGGGAAAIQGAAGGAPVQAVVIPKHALGQLFPLESTVAKKIMFSS